MSRDPKQTAPLPPPKAGASVEQTASEGEVAVVKVAGLIGEHFAGFGKLDPEVKSLVIDVSGMTRMTSFGVRQWLKAMDAVPKTVTDFYVLGCPTFFVDQLNMVLNFGGAAKVLTVVAPYSCPSCGSESSETVDVLKNRSTLAKGGVPELECSKCGGKLEFDETPESYFSFVTKCAASSIKPAAAQLLSSLGLYTALEVERDKPPRIIKLVHGLVTYFRIIGTVGAMFRARPFLVGAEGEVVLDLADVDRFDPAAGREWKRLLKTLGGQVPSVTLVDLSDSFLAQAADSLTVARNLAVASVLVPYTCVDCDKFNPTSHSIENGQWPFHMPDLVCTACGGVTQPRLSAEAVATLEKANTSVPTASSNLIANRKEILARALTDARVAEAGDNASASVGANDTILGKYQIVRRLPGSGIAEVFLAKQVGIGGFEKPVALKRIQRQALESRHLAVDMFLNEAKIAGRLAHPNIVQVLDVGEEKGALFLATEYVRGIDLRELMQRLQSNHESMPIADVCFIAREIAQALHHAYWSTDLAGNQLSVVHRDVSPHNVVIGFDGAVKLLDFGVAMSSVAEQDESAVAGKWSFMSPEHAADQPVDHRSDLFSLGAVIYVLCTGSLPFAGTNPREIAKKIRSGQYRPAHTLVPDLPPALDALVAHLLAPQPEDRPQTGQEVVAALVEITRTNGLDPSASSLASLTARLFADDVADKSEAPLGVQLRTSRKFAVEAGPPPEPADTVVAPVNIAPAAPRYSQSLPVTPRPRPTVASAKVAPATNWRTVILVAVIIVVAAALYFVVKPT